MSDRPARSRRLRAGSERRTWGPADWAHHRRGRRIAERHRRERRRRWAARLGGVAGAVAAVVVVAGLSARHVRPTAGWPTQIAALLLPALGPALGVSAVAVGALAVRSRRVGVGAAAAALAVAAGAVLFRNAAPPPAPPGVEGLRVTTLNVGGGSAEAAYRLEEYLGRTAPHVVLFQEADVRTFEVRGEPAMTYDPMVQTVLSAGYEVGGDLLDVDADRAGPAHRLPFLSRLPVLDHSAGALGPLDTDPSEYARVEVEWRGRRVALYNVHLRAFNPSAGWSLDRALDPAVWAETPARLRAFFAVQAEEAERLAALLDSETLPFVVAGDFNATSDQWSRALLGHRAREVLGRRPWAATRPDAVPIAPIDGVLVGAGWAVRSAAVGPRGLSDHRAVSAELVLTPDR